LIRHPGCIDSPAEDRSMANITLQALSARCSAAPTRVSFPVLGVTLTALVFGGYAGALTAAIFNVVSPRFG
jgi:biotin transporter BioY